MNERLLERGKTSGRSDDNIETINKRLEVFKRVAKKFIKKIEPESNSKIITLIGEQSKH